MATAVETLEKLERRMTITLPLANVNAEVEKRLKVRARTTKAPGFRPGKVPMKMVAAQFGSQVENEVLNEQVGRAFAEAARENNLRVAGYPNITPKENVDEAAEAIEFDATFEVYPDVKFGELSTVEVEKAVAEVTDVEIDKTVDILRKQRSHFHVKGEQGAHGDGGEDQSAQSGDQVTIDFVGSIDGTEFEGGKAEDFVFILGEGRMLPEFEEGTIGLKAGESRTFNVTFPEDYHGEDVAGKTAEFTLTLKKVEWAHLPEVDEDFAKSLGIEDGDITKMREDIRTNLEREVKTRVESKTKDSVMDALIKVTELDVPKTLLEQEEQRLAQMMRQDMAQRGMDIKDMPFPPGVFAEQAERRVRLGLILADIVKENELHVTPEQVKTQVEDFARSYEDPQQVIQYYYSDRNRLAEVEALVLEENVVKYVLDKAKVAEKKFEFDDLMSNNAQA